MNTKSFQFAVAATLLITCLRAGNATAQNFSVDIGGVVYHGVTSNLESAVSAIDDEVTLFLDDSPGAALPGSSEAARVIPGGDGVEDLYPTFGGVLAYANDHGSFRAHLAGGTGVAPGEAVENQVLLIWERDFVKGDEATPFHFIVNPGVLRLVDSRNTPVFSNEDQEASWRLTAKVGGITQFEAFKRLHGKGSFNSRISAVRNSEFRNNYRMTDDTGPVSGELKFIGETLHVPERELFDSDGNKIGVEPAYDAFTYIGGQYKTPSFQGTLDLTGIGVGETFTVEYQLSAHTLSFGPDTLAESMSGDPLKYTGGVITEYGDYGEVFRITEFTMDSMGQRRIEYPSDTSYYYILNSGEAVEGIDAPLALTLGADGTGELIDARPANDPPSAFYLVKKVHQSVPLDSDGDDIDDVYELNRPAILNPLDPIDALADTDEDGRNARQEYLEGTDPESPDEVPNSSQLYPALMFAIGGGSDLETADLNNDGVADLIAFNASLGVSIGNADGTFAPPATVAIPGGGGLGDITLGKLNADDFPDVVFADELNDRVEILFGDGLGGFTSHAKYDLGASPRRAVLALVNEDSHPDIIAVNNIGASVSLLLGNGDGTFQPATNIDTESRPTDAVTALLNDDTHPDLLVTLESGGSRVAVFLNNGDATFASKVTYVTGGASQRVASGDVNGDDFADVITSNQSGDGVSVLLGNGDGTLQAKVDYPTGDNPRGLLVTDLNNDTDLDLLVAHVGANYHSMLLNDGSGTFTNAGPVLTFSGNHNVLFVDVDRDGLQDIVSRVFNDQAMVSHGLPGGGFDTREQFSFGRGELSPRDFEIADLNADGRPDIFISNQSQNTVDILQAQEAGGFTLLPSSPVGEKMEGMAVAPLNTGASLDLAVVTQRPDFFPGNSSNQLHVLYADGAGGFTPEPPVDLHAQPNEVFAGDFDGNGLTDLLVAFNVTGEVQYFTNSNSGFSPQMPIALGDAFSGGYGTRLAGDFNNDDSVDFAAAVHVGGPALIKVILGTNSGVFTESQTITPLNAGSAGKLALGEVTGDSQPDLLAVVITAGGQNLVAYPGNPDGTFGAEQLLIDGYAGDIAVADVNNDGLPDLLSGSTIRLAEEGGYAPPQSYLIGGTSLPVQVRDMNGDGRPDLIAADDLADAISILHQR